MKQLHGTRRAFGLGVGAAALVGLAPQAMAQDFPARGKPIRIVVGFTAGGGTDAQARIVAQKLGEVLGTSVIVDNRPGASTMRRRHGLVLGRCQKRLQRGRRRRRQQCTNGGCGGRFKVTRSYAQGNGNNNSNNAGAAVAAVAAIAGIALLANHNKHDSDRRPDYPDYGNGGGRGGEIRVDGRLCLDVTKGNFRPGNALQVFDCNGTDSQRFSVGRGGEIRVRDLCLDVERGDPRDGARVVLWSCSGAPSQRWTTRGGQIVSQMSGKCLDVVDGRVRQGNQTMVWQCNRSPSQRWWW